MAQNTLKSMQKNKENSLKIEGVFYGCSTSSLCSFLSKNSLAFFATLSTSSSTFSLAFPNAPCALPFNSLDSSPDTFT